MWRSVRSERPKLSRANISGETVVVSPGKLHHRVELVCSNEAAGRQAGSRGTTTPAWAGAACAGRRPGPGPGVDRAAGHAPGPPRTYLLQSPCCAHSQGHLLACAMSYKVMRCTVWAARVGWQAPKLAGVAVAFTLLACRCSPHARSPGEPSRKAAQRSTTWCRLPPRSAA